VANSEYCVYCGKILRGNEDVCSYCGATVKKDTVEKRIDPESEEPNDDEETDVLPKFIAQILFGFMGISIFICLLPNIIEFLRRFGIG
jgi:hypothetical protein